MSNHSNDIYCGHFCYKVLAQYVLMNSYFPRKCPTSLIPRFICHLYITSYTNDAPFFPFMQKSFINQFLRKWPKTQNFNTESNSISRFRYIFETLVRSGFHPYCSLIPCKTIKLTWTPNALPLVIIHKFNLGKPLITNPKILQKHLILNLPLQYITNCTINIY